MCVCVCVCVCVCIHISKRHQNGYTLGYIKSDKINFSKRLLQESKRTLYTDTRGQSQRGPINYVHVYVCVCVSTYKKHQSPKIYEVGMDTIDGRNKQLYNTNWRL